MTLIDSIKLINKSKHIQYVFFLNKFTATEIHLYHIEANYQFSHKLIPAYDKTICNLQRPEHLLNGQEL